MRPSEVAKNMTDLLGRFKELARIHADTDYADMRSVEQGNSAVHEMIDISRRVSQSGAEAGAAFATLLDEPAHKVQLWAAHSILERMSYDEVVRNRALEVVRQYAGGEGVDSLGERMWLKEREANLGHSPQAVFDDGAA